MDPELQQSIDRLLLDMGEYQPLEYLLQEGRLDYSDYEAWRRGELDYLEDRLFGDPMRVRDSLADAEVYLQRLGWVAETTDYRSRGGRLPEARLRFSRDSASDVCFHRRFRRPEDQPQLDLFTDNPANTLFNGVVAALIDTDSVAARQLMDRLLDTAPDHARLGELECLVAALEGLDTPAVAIDEALVEAETLLTPMANDLLGASARHLMVPVWRRLAAALAGVAFDVQRPDLHASYAAAQALDWLSVRDSVECESDWQGQAVLLERHAMACERLHDDMAAWNSWSLLCWRFSERAAALECSYNSSLRSDWEEFQDLEPPLADVAFPAWRLLRRPGLALQLSADDDSAPASYRPVRLLCLQGIEQTTDQARDVVALRAEIQALDPALLQHCITRLSSRMNR